MSHRKIVYVIVEGPSDDTALGVMFNRLYDKNLVHVEITHGDITTGNYVSADNIAARIGNRVRSYATSYHLKATDFQEVIHILDTDGAFVPDSAIVADSNAVEVFYTESEIRTDKPVAIIRRNAGKKNVLLRLASLCHVWKTIPYHAYYMSCNLDHVLYNKQNSTDAEKEIDAYRFAKHYSQHLSQFLNFICDSDFSVITSYKESWDFIQRELNSLNRHSNLGLCFAQFKNISVSETA